MKILVIEDERIVGQRLIRMLQHILGSDTTIRHQEDIYDGLAYIREHPIDLLFLDLNLNGSDGFRILTEAVSGSFQTIIVSAHPDQALRAFEYGVTDFVAKPFTEERLKKALERVIAPDPRLRSRLKCLALRKGRQLCSIPVAEILYVKGADDYSEIHCKDGSIHLHDKTLGELEKRMPENFRRLHRSYLVNIDFLTAQENEAGSRYRVILSNGEKLLLSRKKLQLVRTLLNQ